MRAELAARLSDRTQHQLNLADEILADMSADTITAVRETLASVGPDLAGLADQLNAHADALKEYAAAVDAIRIEAAILARDEFDARTALARAESAITEFFSWTHPGPSTPVLDAARDEEHNNLLGRVTLAEEELSALQRRRDLLVERRRDADHVCTARLNYAPKSLAALAGQGTANVTDGVSLAAALSGMSAAQIAAYLAAHPGTAKKLEDLTPEQAAAFWRSLDDADATRSAAQLMLITALPLVIGNLNGIRLADRAAANKLNLTSAIDSVNRQIWFAEQAGRPDLVKNLAKERDYYLELRDGTVTFYDPVSVGTVSQQGHTILAFDRERDTIAEYSGFLDPVTGGIPSHIRNLGLYIPGTGTTMLGFKAEVEHSEWLVKNARLWGTIGMITWKGGYFPQGMDAADGALARERGTDLTGFWAGIAPPASTETAALGYSFGGAILGKGERLGLDADRVLYVSSAGLGHDIQGIDEFPNTRHAPHYSMMAPDDSFVGYSQGIQADLFGVKLGHGASPLTTDGVTRLETGYNVAHDPDSGQLTGHLDVWKPGGTAIWQVLEFVQGGNVELYADPGAAHVTTVPGTIGPIHSQPHSDQPIMDPGYHPKYEDVEGGTR